MVARAAGGDESRFGFDRVWAGTHTTADVASDVLPLVTSFLDGHNVCIMAYGQTGAGKTHTIIGTAEDPGMVPRCMAKCFEAVQNSAAEASYALHMSVLEDYLL